jgi:hypothetical protein
MIGLGKSESNEKLFYYSVKQKVKELKKRQNFLQNLYLLYYMKTVGKICNTRI